jgi:RimJ/RimL family protein N-acetyltransferase
MARRFASLPSDDAVALRPWRDDDVPFLLDACNDPEIARFTELPSPYTLEHARAWVPSARWLLELDREAHLAVADAATDAPLGACGLVKVDWRAGVGEAGYWTAPDARGRGVATRALRLLAAWALGPVGLRRLTLRIHAENLTSQGVARRAGAFEHDDRNSHGILVFALASPPPRLSH